MSDLDCDKIKTDVLKRQIKRLCHFTQSRKLPFILSDPGGIYSVEWLEKNRPDILDKNDLTRIDGFPDYISCSIEYPNTWYLSKAKARDPLFVDWTVILLKPDILWCKGARFSYRNAAAVRSGVLEGYTTFCQMFAPSIVGAYGKEYKRGPTHLNSCPTDGQAEVLIKQCIPFELITGLVFKDSDNAKKEIGRLRTLGIDFSRLDIYNASHFFDHSWHSSVSEGKKLKEIKFVE